MYQVPLRTQTRLVPLFDLLFAVTLSHNPLYIETKTKKKIFFGDLKKGGCLCTFHVFGQLDTLHKRMQMFVLFNFVFVQVLNWTNL